MHSPKCSEGNKVPSFYAKRNICRQRALCLVTDFQQSNDTAYKKMHIRRSSPSYKCKHLDSIFWTWGCSFLILYARGLYGWKTLLWILYGQLFRVNHISHILWLEVIWKKWCFLHFHHKTKRSVPLKSDKFIKWIYLINLWWIWANEQILRSRCRFTLYIPNKLDSFWVKF